MSNGKINEELSFPIIVLINNDVTMIQELNKYLICKKTYIPQLNRLKEIVIDSSGWMYKRGNVTPLNYINIFNGFSLKYAGFGLCYVKKQVEKIKLLSSDELKIEGLKILKNRDNYFSGVTLNIKKWKMEFEQLQNREDILRYMFYFADTSRYYNPDIKDGDWRSRRGFVKNSSKINK